MPIPAGYTLGPSGFYFYQDGSGPYSIDQNSQPHLISTLKEYLIEIGFGAIPGHNRIAALGNNPNISTAGLPEYFWPPSIAYPWPSTPVMVEAVSDSTQDSPTGTGVGTITWQFLDSTYTQAPATLIMNGTTPVAHTAPILRVNPTLVGTLGTGSATFGRTNVGNITLRVAGGGAILAYIPAGEGITTQCIFTVPLGFTAQILEFYVGINRIQAAGQIRYLTVKNYLQTSAGLYRTPLSISISSSAPYRHPGMPGVGPIAEKTDFALRATSVSDDGTDATAAVLAILRSNSQL